MTRRDFLVFALPLLLSKRLGHPLPRSIAAKPPDNAVDAMLDVLGSRTSARVVGSAYLELHPREANLHRLRAALDFSLARTHLTNVRKLFVDQQRADFASGRVVRVNGWILSETEAKLCAMAALL